MKNLGIFSNGCYTFRGVKVGNTIYGKVKKSMYSSMYRVGEYTQVRADTFHKIPKPLWRIIKQMR